jgi:hypothetical protein
MACPRFIEIDGKRYLWRDLVALRRAQARKPPAAQPTLFALQEDHRPPVSARPLIVTASPASSPGSKTATDPLPSCG